jgi:hypothetical protein
LYSEPSKTTDVRAPLETNGDRGVPPQIVIDVPSSQGASAAIHRAAPFSQSAAVDATAAVCRPLAANEMLTFQRGEESVYGRGDVRRRDLEFLLKARADRIAAQSLLEERPDARPCDVQLKDAVALEMDENGGPPHVARDDARIRPKIRLETGTLSVIHG